MHSLSEVLTVYKQQHKNHLNRIFHYIGIPAVVFSLLMLLNWISIDIARVWVIPFSWFLLIGALVYYYMLNVRLALLTTVIGIIITWLAILVAGPTPGLFHGIIFLILFVGGWAFLFAGHFIEKNKPAFLQAVHQLLIGPLYVLLELLAVLKLKHFFVDEHTKTRQRP